MCTYVYVCMDMCDGGTHRQCQIFIGLNFKEVAHVRIKNYRSSISALTSTSSLPKVICMCPSTYL
jgi:hypothetical protein